MKTIPNILSIFRICLVPVFVLCFVFDTNEIKWFAVIVFVIANASDILDGYIARRYNAQSRIGRILDPLGDKLIVFSALVCIAVARTELIWVACVYFVKEALMGIGGYLIEKREVSEFPSSNRLGKTATVVLFIVCVATLIFTNFPGIIYTVMFSIAVLFSLLAFINYLYIFVKLMKR